MHGVRAADEDRLPWLEPYRETNQPDRPLPRSGYGKPLAIGFGAALLIVVGGAGYWLGKRSEEPARPQPSATIALPAPRPAPVQIVEAPPAAEPSVAVTAAVEPAKAANPTPVRKVAKRHQAPRRKIHIARAERTRFDSVQTAQKRQALRRPWPKMPSPGPAGQVIQLGAFTTPVRANNAYSMRIARYPALARMPKVVVPVITRPDGRVLYVLRLGTTSRQQSKTVCRNLRASGDHCLVIG